MAHQLQASSTPFESHSVSYGEEAIVLRHLARGVDLRTSPPNFLDEYLPQGMRAPPEAFCGQALGDEDSVIEKDESACSTLGQPLFDGGSRLLPLANFIGQCNFLASANAMKFLLRAMIDKRLPVSLALHRIGGSLLLDGIVTEDNSNSSISRDDEAKQKNDEENEKQRLLLSRFLYRSALPDESSDVISDPLVAPTLRLPAPPLPSERGTATDAAVVPQPLVIRVAGMDAEASSTTATQRFRSVLPPVLPSPPVIATIEDFATLLSSFPPSSTTSSKVIENSSSSSSSASSSSFPNSAASEKNDSSSSSSSSSSSPSSSSSSAWFQRSKAHTMKRQRERDSFIRTRSPSAANAAASSATFPTPSTSSANSRVPFRNITLMQLGPAGGGGVSMVLGSDLLTVRFKTHATEEVASVHLREASKPITHAEALDLYLDARLGGASALAVCLHSGGKMVGYDLVKTEDVLSLARGSGSSDVELSAKDVEVGALSLLRFLQDSCVRDGSYLLYRSGGEDTTLRLFDLSGSTLSPGKLEFMASSAANATSSSRAPTGTTEEASSAASALLKHLLAAPEAWAVNLATIALEYAQVVLGKAQSLQQESTIVLRTKEEAPANVTTKTTSSQRIHLLLLRRRLLQESIDIMTTQDKNATFVDRLDSRNPRLSSSSTKYSQLLCALHCQIASAYLSIADELELDTTDVPSSVFEGMSTTAKESSSSSSDSDSLRDAKRIHVLTALNEAAKNLVLSIRLNRLQNDTVMGATNDTLPSLYPDEKVLFIDLSSAAHRIVSLLLSEHEPINRAAAPLQDAELAFTVIEDILRLHHERHDSITEFPSIASSLIASMLGNTVYWITRIFLSASASHTPIVSDSLVASASALSFSGKPHSQAFVIQLHDQSLRDNKAMNSLSAQLSLKATLLDFAMGRLCGSFTTLTQLSHVCLLLYDASSLLSQASSSLSPSPSSFSSSASSEKRTTHQLKEGSLTFNLLREAKRRLGNELVSAGRTHVSNASLPAAIACFSRAVDVFDDVRDLTNKSIAMTNVSSVLRTLGASGARHNTATVLFEGEDTERDESCQFGLYRDASSLANAFKDGLEERIIEPSEAIEEQGAKATLTTFTPTTMSHEIIETIVSTSITPQSATLLQKALDVAIDALRMAKEAVRAAKGDSLATEASTAAFEMALHGTSQSALVFGALLSQEMRVVSPPPLSSERPTPVSLNDYSLALFTVASKAISQSSHGALLKPLASIKLQLSLHLTRLTRLLHQRWPQSENFTETRSSALSALSDAASAFLKCSEPSDRAFSCHCYVEKAKLLCELKGQIDEDEEKIFHRLKLAVCAILSCSLPLSSDVSLTNKKDLSDIYESVLQAASLAIRLTLSALKKSKKDQSDAVKRCTALYSECLRLIGGSSSSSSSSSTTATQSRTVSLVLERMKEEEWLYK